MLNGSPCHCVYCYSDTVPPCPHMGYGNFQVAPEELATLEAQACQATFSYLPGLLRLPLLKQCSDMALCSFAPCILLLEAMFK